MWNHVHEQNRYLKIKIYSVWILFVIRNIKNIRFKINIQITIMSNEYNNTSVFNFS